MQDFKDGVAVVTGAASGIGLATATRFAREGMKVVLGDIQQDALDTAVSSLQSAGHDVIGVTTDVSRVEQVQNLADQAIAAYGKVNVVHNNAGVVRAGTLEELTLEDWQWVLGVDLWSVIYGVKIFLPLIKQAGQGHIVNTSSSAGLQASAHWSFSALSRSGTNADMRERSKSAGNWFGCGERIGNGPGV
jgi:NAD(P)-dependent dehydrogenase (short-subunit alcohol dehydrogenase family)